VKDYFMGVMLRHSKHERIGLYALLSRRAIYRLITCQRATSREACWSGRTRPRTCARM